jgi:hypothetical protein
MIDPGWLGFFAVLGTSIFVVLRPLRFFSRNLSLEEAFSVCWVALAIYMGTFAAYVGLILPLGLSRDARIWAVGIAVCISLSAILYLARVCNDWQRAVTRSIFGLFYFIFVVAAAVHFFLVTHS